MVFSAGRIRKGAPYILWRKVMEGYRQFFGLMHVSGSIPEKTREKVMETAKAIYGRHYAEAKKGTGTGAGPHGPWDRDGDVSGKGGAG